MKTPPPNEAPPRRRKIYPRLTPDSRIGNGFKVAASKLARVHPRNLSTFFGRSARGGVACYRFRSLCIGLDGVGRRSYRRWARPLGSFLGSPGGASIVRAGRRSLRCPLAVASRGPIARLRARSAPRAASRWFAGRQVVPRSCDTRSLSPRGVEDERRPPAPPNLRSGG